MATRGADPASAPQPPLQPGIKPKPFISTSDPEFLFSILEALSFHHRLRAFPALPLTPLISRVPNRALHPSHGLHLGEKTPTPRFPGRSLFQEKLLSGAEETRRIAALLVSSSERNWVLTVSTALGVTVAVVWGDTAPFRAGCWEPGAVLTDRAAAIQQLFQFPASRRHRSRGPSAAGRLGEDYLQYLVGEMEIEPQDHGMVWAGRELEDHPVTAGHLPLSQIVPRSVH